jgi:hypothetical protein
MGGRTGSRGRRRCVVYRGVVHANVANDSSTVGDQGDDHTVSAVCQPLKIEHRDNGTAVGNRDIWR